MKAEGRTVLTAEEIRTIEVDFPEDDPVHPGTTGHDLAEPATDHTMDGPRPPPGPPPGWHAPEDEDDTGPDRAAGETEGHQSQKVATSFDPSSLCCLLVGPHK